LKNSEWDANEQIFWLWKSRCCTKALAFSTVQEIEEETEEAAVIVKAATEDGLNIPCGNCSVAGTLMAHCNTKCCSSIVPGGSHCAKALQDLFKRYGSILSIAQCEVFNLLADNPCVVIK